MPAEAKSRATGKRLRYCARGAARPVVSSGVCAVVPVAGGAAVTAGGLDVLAVDRLCTAHL
jgi:hypothetical protein